jgi:hypothetical protein
MGDNGALMLREIFEDAGRGQRIRPIRTVQVGIPEVCENRDLMDYLRYVNEEGIDWGNIAAKHRRVFRVAN